MLASRALLQGFELTIKIPHQWLTNNSVILLSLSACFGNVTCSSNETILFFFAIKMFHNCIKQLEFNGFLLVSMISNFIISFSHSVYKL